MLHESNETAKISIQGVETNFENVHEKMNYSKEIIKEIEKANVLILPHPNGYKDHDKPLFPEETRDFFFFAKEQSAGTDAVVDICASDEDFQELELHADLVILPTILLSTFVYPFVVNMISSYVYEKARTRNKEIKIKVDLVVEDDGKSKKISYEGDPDKFESVMKSIKLLDE